MSYIVVRLEDSSIIQIPSGVFNMIPHNATVLNKQINNLLLIEKKEKSCLPYNTDVSFRDQDPFGLKKPIASSNKKY